MGPPPQTDLKEIARRLARDGPVKTLPTPRRVRFMFAGAFVADTIDGALYVWEHEFYPQLYLPMNAFVQPSGFDVVMSSGESIEDDQGNIIGGQLKLSVKPTGSSSSHYRTLKDMVLFAEDLDGPGKMLRNFVKVSFNAVDQWFEEDTPIYVHPKDPFKRVDILTSTRPIRIGLQGTIIAESQTSMHLYETLLPARYYLPLTAINTALLRPSSTRSQCPYKGEAEYHNIVLENGREVKDVVWYYRQPTVECAAITGLRCFFNEKVDIWLMEGGEWKKQERPTTHFT